MSQTTERTETLRTSRNAIKIINQADLRYAAERRKRTVSAADRARTRVDPSSSGNMNRPSDPSRSLKLSTMSMTVENCAVLPVEKCAV